MAESALSFRSLVENQTDVVARFDAELRYLYVNPAVEQVTGRPAFDYPGRTNREAGVSPELTAIWDAALRRVFATGQAESLEVAFDGAAGPRQFDCRLVAERGPGGAVESVLSVARDVTERWQAHDSERRARAVAEALREATEVLARSLDRETVLTTLLERLRRMVHFERAAIFLVDEAQRFTLRVRYDGERVLSLPAGSRTVLDAREHGVLRRILATRAPVRIPDLRREPGWSLPIEELFEVSWLGIPLFARGAVAGLITLSQRRAGSFDEGQVELVEAIASQASVAVDNAVLFEQMQVTTGRLQALSRRLVEVQESERRHIARELHDEAGQALASLRFGLRRLEREIEEGGTVTGRVAELVERTDMVIDGLHRLASDLRPASLDHLGLEAALRQYTRSVGAKFGLEVRFKARGFGGARLPAAVETALYRVVQEATTNVVRHARAARLDVLVEQRGDRVAVMVEDDGIGFDPTAVEVGDHFGLLGLRERAEGLGGTLTVESAPGAGTTVVVEVSCADTNPDR